MDLVKISKKWQKKWQDAQIFKVSHDFKKKKFYVLEMYCYPSSHLHMGHLKNYSLTDASARYKRLNGFNVLYPTGYDSFGLPAENAAIKYGDNPKDYTERNITRIREQQKAIGWSYDWSREIASHRLDYTKWDQYFFLKLFEKGLAYRDNAPVNFCPSCKTRTRYPGWHSTNRTPPWSSGTSLIL